MPFELTTNQTLKNMLFELSSRLHDDNDGEDAALSELLSAAIVLAENDGSAAAIKKAEANIFRIGQGGVLFTVIEMQNKWGVVQRGQLDAIAWAQQAYEVVRSELDM